jgi:hypothetical protein
MNITFKGRTLPFNDWEGDDMVPGAHGDYVTCMDTAAGRAAFWATNGRVNVTGKTIRRHVRPYDSNGITFEQVDQALQSVNKYLSVEHPAGWDRAKVTSWLKAGKGLIVTGIYSTIPREYRHQLSGNFGHAMFVTNFNREGTAMRLYDPLNPLLHERGKHVPSSILWPFLASRGFQVGYVPLHPLKVG